VGYTARGEGVVKVPSAAEMIRGMKNAGLGTAHIAAASGGLTSLGRELLDYFEYRSKQLNEYVEPRLMDAEQAEFLFEELRARLKPSCPLPMNKQRGAKRTPAFLTGIVNMLIEGSSRGHPCEYDPRQLTSFTRGGAPLRTLSRRVDGAFPSAVNPIAVWEVKEYYYTTTFGSRVADGVYETLLDGMELKQLRDDEGVSALHYLMIDAHFTWWKCGKSYLCRIIDMLHMEYIDEVFFGREVVERLPGVVESWLESVAG
jgi:hypothetical protein